MKMTKTNQTLVVALNNKVYWTSCWMIWLTTLLNLETTHLLKNTKLIMNEVIK